MDFIRSQERNLKLLRLGFSFFGAGKNLKDWGLGLGGLGWGNRAWALGLKIEREEKKKVLSFLRFLSNFLLMIMGLFLSRDALVWVFSSDSSL